MRDTGLTAEPEQGRAGGRPKDGAPGKSPGSAISNNCFLLAIYTSVVISVFVQGLGELSFPLLTRPASYDKESRFQPFAPVPKDPWRRRAAQRRGGPRREDAQLLLRGLPHCSAFAVFSS